MTARSNLDKDIYVWNYAKYLLLTVCLLINVNFTVKMFIYKYYLRGIFPNFD